jgi:hypothetical protein
MSSQKGLPRYLTSWHVTPQPAGTKQIAKRAIGGEKKQKQWAGYFLGRIDEDCILIFRPQPTPIAVVCIDEEFPLPLLIPCVRDIWTKISAGVGNA